MPCISFLNDIYPGWGIISIAVGETHGTFAHIISAPPFKKLLIEPMHTVPVIFIQNLYAPGEGVPPAFYGGVKG